MLGSHPSRWIIFLVSGALSALGCVGTTDTGGDGETGSLSVQLVLADGIEIDEVTWQITGNQMDMSGDIDVSAPESTASVEVFGLPGATDYLVTLTATSTDETVTCRGSAPFDVEVGVATPVMVMLNCKKPRTLGGVRVNGKFNICAELAKVVVSPLQTSIGNDISLFSQGVDAEGDPISYIWTGTGGSIADPSAPNTTYTCQEVGEQSVTIMVTDNDDYCRMATWTVPVRCEPGDIIDRCEDVVCEDDGNQCTEAECDPANGECVTSNVEDGTLCDIVGIGAGTCSSGQCVEENLCEDVDCNDDNDCTGDECDPTDGSCINTDVSNGTPCNDDTGMCLDGNCVDIVDKCDGVICDDTGNDCTVAMCNSETGICDVMNVTDGTECNGGAGACSAGDCVDNNLCQEIDCSSDNECVQDGTCNPLDGLCIAGDNEPIDTGCTAGGTVCDGAGACVECNNEGQCPDDGNECMARACESNACVQNNVTDGQSCDFDGSPGMCEAGTCVASDMCTSPDQCDDLNPCTANSCPDGMCVFTPEDGGDCNVSPGVPGTCTAGDCVGLCDGSDCSSDNQCVQDGTCDDQTGLCIEGDNQPINTVCTLGGAFCDGGGNCVECNIDGQCPGSESCVDNSCVAQALPCGFQTRTVTIGCTNNVTTAQSPFPWGLEVDVPTAISGGGTFEATFAGVGVFPEFFLDAAQAVVPGGVSQAILEGWVATVAVRSGATGPEVPLGVDASSLDPGETHFCTIAPSTDTVCDPANDSDPTDPTAGNSDCLPVFPGNYCDPTINLIATVPTSTDCGAVGTCADLGKVSQCSGSGTIGDPNDGFCVTGDLIASLAPETATYTADTSGEVLFGWWDNPATDPVQPSGLSICPGDDRCATNGGTDPAIPDGSLTIPLAVYALPTPPLGIRVNVAGALFVPIQCAMGEDGGSCSVTATTGCLVDGDCPSGETCVGVGVDNDIIMPTPDSSLISCPINE